MQQSKNQALKCQQIYTTKSIICPDINTTGTTKLKWYRLAPYPYQVQQLKHYADLKQFYCSNLDLDCTIKFRLFQQDQFIYQQSFGPILPFLHCKINSQIELKVNVSLFNVTKKCFLYIYPVLVLVNPLNGAKYQFTNQDIKSVYLKSKSYKEQLQNSDNSQTKQAKNALSKNSGIIYNKNTIIISNLFQRLILLKLFHEIPNGTYCYNMQVLQITFFDLNACNLALQAINDLKYPNKNTRKDYKISIQNTKIFRNAPNATLEHSFSNGSDLGKSTISIKNQVKLNQKAKIIDINKEKQSFDSKFVKLNNDKNKTNEIMKKYQDDFAKSSKSSLTKKTPKQSLISINQSITSKSSMARQSKSSLYNNSSSKDPNNSSIGLTLSPSSKNIYYNNQSIKTPKAPKISILSTDMASIRQKRQQKQSFPDIPSSNNLKSSELIKPLQKNGELLTLRRSQEQLKTPRSQLDNKQSKKAYQVQYADQFQSLLFNRQNDQQEGQQICLNDSFQKMENNQKSLNKIVNKKQESKHKQQKEWNQMKNQIQYIFKQNKVLKQKNFKIVQEICDSKQKNKNSIELSKLEIDLQCLKKQQKQLQDQILVLKVVKIQNCNYQNIKVKGFRNSNYIQKQCEDSHNNNQIINEPINLQFNRNSEGFPINRPLIPNKYKQIKNSGHYQQTVSKIYFEDKVSLGNKLNIPNRINVSNITNIGNKDYIQVKISKGNLGNKVISDINSNIRINQRGNQGYSYKYPTKIVSNQKCFESKS